MNGHEDEETSDAQAIIPATIGAYLRDIRISRKLGLDEVSEATGISTAVLQALESENREQLPAEVYIKAFYKKYAEHLGLDPEEVNSKYLQQNKNLKETGRRSSFSTVVTLKGQEENLLGVTLRRLIIPIVIIILGILFYWIYTNYLAPYNPLGYYREYFPQVSSLFLSHFTDFFS